MSEHVLDVPAMLADRPALLREACDRALTYLASVAERPVAPSEAAVAALDDLDFALPAAGLNALEVLRRLDTTGSPATVASNGPRYFGFVTGGALPVAEAAAWLGAAWDQNAALTVMHPWRRGSATSRCDGSWSSSACPWAQRVASSAAPPWRTQPAWRQPGMRC